MHGLYGHNRLENIMFQVFSTKSMKIWVKLTCNHFNFLPQKRSGASYWVCAFNWHFTVCQTTDTWVTFFREFNALVRFVMSTRHRSASLGFANVWWCSRCRSDIAVRPWPSIIRCWFHWHHLNIAMKLQRTDVMHWWGNVSELPERGEGRERESRKLSIPMVSTISCRSWP